MHALTLASFLFFTGLVAFVTWRITRRDDHRSTSGYFLAGRTLTFPLIAASMLMTNLSTEQMVGLNGSAFTDGLSVMAWEVIAVIALVALALFFLPRFLKSGIATLPQLLAIRFDTGTQLIANVIFPDCVRGGTAADHPLLRGHRPSGDAGFTGLDRH